MNRPIVTWLLIILGILAIAWMTKTTIDRAFEYGGMVKKNMEVHLDPGGSENQGGH